MNTVAIFYNKQLVGLEKNFYVALEKYDEEAIHNMRLAFKRIKAIYKFVKNDLNNTSIFNDQIIAFNGIYKSAGKIREVQINRNLINKYFNLLDKPINDYLTFLDTEEDEAKLLLIEQLKLVNIINLSVSGFNIFEFLDKFSEKKFYKNSIKFVNKKIRNIESLIFNNTDEDKYHTIRKNIKEAYFILRLFHKKKRLKELNFKLNHLKNIEITLGEWHDNDILLKHLSDFFKKKHITNFNSQNSRYKPLLDIVNNAKHNLIENIDLKIIRINLKMLYFNGIKEIELVKHSFAS